MSLLLFLPFGPVHSDRGTLKSPIMIMDSSTSPLAYALHVLMLYHSFLSKDFLYNF